MPKRLNDIQSEVSSILRRVRSQGDEALCYYARKFDGVNLAPGSLRVPGEKLKAAYRSVDEKARTALGCAEKRISGFHEAEYQRLPFQWQVGIEGLTVGQKANPIDSVGLYIPGGRFAYPSTVLMTALPAKIAGVRRIVLVSPPGQLKNEVLAAAYLCGIKEFYQVGGAQAIAALAYGTRSIPKVDKVAGPGNRYVTEAKRQLYGVVGIDGLAGPSEIVVWMESGSDPVKAAHNLMAQAEHDPDARSYLISQSKPLLEKVRNEVNPTMLKQISFEHKPSRRSAIARVNAIAPEHLYLMVSNPRSVVNEVCNAGAIFVGEQTPVALGDYVAGPSHVLPTKGSAKFSSGLSVKEFIKWTSVIENRAAVNSEIFESARILAEIEGLTHHLRSLQ